MATNSLLQSSSSLKHRPAVGRRQSTDCPPATLTIPNTNYNYNHSHKISISSGLKTFSLSSATSSSSSQSITSSLDLLQRLLSAKDFLEADNETRRLLIALAGEPAQKRGYVFFSEVQFIAGSDLKAIDQLWLHHSNNRFGYSVQKRLWEKSDRDFTRFFIKVGWMKKLDTEVVQYNYRAFPDEFIWELNDETPEGHLPLTNALRGTQLLTCILTHPAFDDDVETPVQEEEKPYEGRDKKQLALGKGLSKPNYSF